MPALRFALLVLLFPACERVVADACETPGAVRCLNNSPVECMENPPPDGGFGWYNLRLEGACSGGTTCVHPSDVATPFCALTSERDPACRKDGDFELGCVEGNRIRTWRHCRQESPDRDCGAEGGVCIDDRDGCDATICVLSAATDPLCPAESGRYCRDDNTFVDCACSRTREVRTCPGGCFDGVCD